jgi:hypothetical protein
VKNLPANGKKIFARDISNKRLISRTYKECSKINEKYQYKQKWANDVKKYFT